MVTHVQVISIGVPEVGLCEDEISEGVPVSVIPDPDADGPTGNFRQRLPVPNTSPTLARSGSLVDMCDSAGSQTTRYLLMGIFLCVCVLGWGFNLICMYASPLKPHLGATVFGQGLGRIIASLVLAQAQFKGHALFQPVGDIVFSDVLKDCMMPFACGFLFAFGSMMLSMAVRAAVPAVVLGPGISMYIMFAVVCGIVHKQEQITVKRLIGLSGAVVSAMLLAARTEDDITNGVPSDISFNAEHLIYIAGVCLLWGLSYHLLTHHSSRQSLKLVYITHEFGSFIFGTIILLVMPTHFQVVQERGLATLVSQVLFVASAATLATMGNMSYVLLSRLGKETSLVVPATAAWSLVVCLWGWTIHGEQLNAAQVLGTILSVACTAILLLSVRSATAT